LDKTAAEEYWEDVPPPTTRAELAALKEDQQFWDEGTHTILDMDQVVSSTEDDELDDGAIVRCRRSGRSRSTVSRATNPR
jgi:hypothetical protein